MKWEIIAEGKTNLNDMLFKPKMLLSKVFHDKCKG